MNPIRCFVYVAALAGLTGLGGCVRTHSDVVISQPKPLEVNVNLNGKLTLVVQDASSDMDFIAGDAGHEKSGSPATAPAASGRAATKSSVRPSLYLAPGGRAARIIFVNATTRGPSADILQHLRADFPKNHKLLAAHLVGEAHTGYMQARATLTSAQRAFVAHDNRWRKRLYELRAAQTGQPMATIGLIYFKIRLKYVPVGAWVQHYDPTTGQWTWVHWKK